MPGGRVIQSHGRRNTVKTLSAIVVLVMLGFAYQSFHQDTASGVQCPARSSAPSR
jgi:hypothetical protein